MNKKEVKDYQKGTSALNNLNLKFFTDLLMNVEHFIFFGTLLGVTRDNELIANDDDIDFYVNLKDRNKLINNLKINNIEVDLTAAHNKDIHFLQVKRVLEEKILFTDFYFYENDIEKNFIIERWNFEGGTHKPSKHLKIPKKFIYPIKMIEFNNYQIFVPARSELLCEFLYGKKWKKKFIKDLDYKIKVINGRPHFFLIKRFLFFKWLSLSS